MATTRVINGIFLPFRVLSHSYSSRALSSNYAAVKTVRLFNKRYDRVFQQFHNGEEHRYDEKYGSYEKIRNKTTLILPMLYGFSLFGKSKTEDKEEEEKSAKKDILEDEVITVLKHAKLKEMKHEFPEAEHLYHRALGILNIYAQNNTWDKVHLLEARVYIYDSMANLALARGQLVKAEKLYKETLQGSLQQGMSKTHDAVVEISLKLAMIYAAQKKNHEANEGYEFCIKTQEDKIKDMKEVDDNSAALLGMALDAYARFLMVQNRNDEAQANLEKSLSIARKVYGESHVQVAVLLNDIATVNSLKQDYDLARKNLETAVKIAEGLGSPDLPTFYFNLGAVLERQGNTPEASHAYKQAITIAKKIDDKIVQKKAKDALDSIRKV